MVEGSWCLGFRVEGSWCEKQTLRLTHIQGMKHWSGFRACGPSRLERYTKPETLRKLGCILCLWACIETRVPWALGITAIGIRDPSVHTVVQVLLFNGTTKTF